MPQPDPDSPQILATLASEQEAAIMVGYLDTLGIQARICRVGFGFKGQEDFQVVVRLADMDQAKEALNRIGEQESEIGSNGRE